MNDNLGEKSILNLQSKWWRSRL